MLGRQDLIDFEHRVAVLWENGKINAPIHLSGGNEEQLLNIFEEIKPHDYVFSTHRNHYHALLHGVPAGELMDEICGADHSPCKGRARSMGFIDCRAKFYSSAIVGGMCSVAVGVAWALKQQGNNDPLKIDELASKRHVWCFVGDGVLDGGHFWECWQYAESLELPITFIVEDNNRATCSTCKDRGQVFGVIAAQTSSNKKMRLRYYEYKPAWPHVGTGKYVQF